MKKILIVDDDQNIRNFISTYLKDEGFVTFVAAHGKEALALMEKQSCHLAIVDVMMPVMDGFELTEELRRYYDIPVILLTAKDQISDKGKGFRSGADDYIVKPFEPKELLFRIQALFRRYDKHLDDIIEFGSTKINRLRYEVEIDDGALLLPLKEFELLHFLASHHGQVLTREQIIENVWGIDYEGDERTVDVHIKRLRERFVGKTDDFEIKTIRGVGYSLEEQL
ncbi:response regulator transcription factor [Pueribacillus sp. YX66]|uniref:response regulator transcription factor n=1 Tax=Pueribacillus sp. YX66 TaxID=3229242 RepID=UPI00358D5395